jgi:hypothetical protein
MLHASHNQARWSTALNVTPQAAAGLRDHQADWHFVCTSCELDASKSAAGDLNTTLFHF